MDSTPFTAANLQGQPSSHIPSVPSPDLVQCAGHLSEGANLRGIDEGREDVLPCKCDTLELIEGSLRCLPRTQMD